MRIPFCVLLVVVLLALPAPSHATETILVDDALRKLNDQHNQLQPIVHTATTGQKIWSWFRKPNWFGRKDLELSHSRPAFTKHLGETLDHLQEAVDNILQPGVYPSRWDSAIHDLLEKVETVEGNGLGSLPLVRTPPLASDIDKIRLGIRRLNQDTMSLYVTQRRRTRTWDQLLSSFEVAIAAITTVEERVVGLKATSEWLRKAIGEQKEASKAGGEDEIREEYGNEDYTRWLEPFDKLISWYEQDIEIVRGSLEKFLEDVNTLREKEGLKPWRNPFKEVAEAQV
ncbi:hypothetical protein ACQY0O_005188 [Thecaphora frezii]